MSVTNNQRDFVPALGRHWLTPLYDATIAVTTREKIWRNSLLRRLSPVPSDVILDIGCGTGTLVCRIKNLSPKSELIGIDPDHSVLEIAKVKAQREFQEIRFAQGFGDEIGEKLDGSPINKIVSSLVFHQVPMEGKQSILRAAYDLLPEGGRLYIADFGKQRTALMRSCFKTVQRLDGFEYTQPNADGCLPVLMSEVGFTDVSEDLVVPTMVGSISLYSAQKESEVSFG